MALQEDQGMTIFKFLQAFLPLLHVIVSSSLEPSVYQLLYTAPGFTSRPNAAAALQMPGQS